jgi:hypothetical protein
VRGPADARHPLGPELGLEQHDRRHALGRNESLGERYDPRALGDAESSELGHRLGDPLGRDRQEDQIRAAELVRMDAECPDPQIAGELHARQVALVLTRRREQLRLFGGARQQRRAQGRPLEQDRDSGAERAGADDDGAAGMLARGADEAKLAQVAW